MMDRFAVNLALDMAKVTWFIGWLFGSTSAGGMCSGLKLVRLLDRKTYLEFEPLISCCRHAKIVWVAALLTPKAKRIPKKKQNSSPTHNQKKDFTSRHAHLDDLVSLHLPSVSHRHGNSD
jgi:hypothetical protein